MEWCEKRSPFRFDLSCLQHANFKPGRTEIGESLLSSSGTEGTVALEREKEASQADFKVVWIEKVWSSSNEEAETS